MKPHTDLKSKIGATIRGLRESFGWSQTELAHRLGWASHVIVGNVESGTREIKASELAVLSRVFRVPVDSLLGTDDQRDQKFVLWREVPNDDSVAAEQNAQFLEACDRYTFLEEAVDRSNPRIAPRELPSFSLDIDKTTFDEVASLAEQTREALNLGPYPADDLIRTLEEECYVKIIYLKLPQYRGSAACSVTATDKFIMLNSLEVPWRRNFSLAHELFHLITWDARLFAQIYKDDSLWKKNEQLANAFAAALLMPREQTNRRVKDCVGASKKLKLSDILALARDFQVSVKALLWRLAGLSVISRDSVRQLDDDSEFNDIVKKANTDRSCEDHYRSWRFVRMAYRAHCDGKLSKAKLAQFLDVPLIDVYDELAKFGLVVAHEQKIPISDS